MYQIQGQDYLSWRYEMGQIVAQHDLRKLREAGCTCDPVLREWKNAVLTCGYCGAIAPTAYPKATYTQDKGDVK